MASIDINRVINRMNEIMPKKYSKLKERQTTTLNSCANNDVLAVLPTGYGKTVIIQALPFLSERSGCIIVVNALNGIIEEQRARFGERCVMVTEEIVKNLENTSTSDERIAKTVSRLTNGDETLNFILCHPEAIVHPSMKKVLLSQPLSSRITHVVIDEAHCILSWGNSSFRPAYQKLGLLRAVLPNALVLALTATATKHNQQNIAVALRMQEPKIIVESPDRPNVFLEVMTRPPSTGGEHTSEDAMYEVVDPILKQLKTEGGKFEKTIMYVPLKWCGQLHYRAHTHFLINTDQMQTDDAGDWKDLVSQYHSPQSQHMKSMIVENMQNKDGNLRLLFATEAYGMGIDVEDIQHVVHVGPPSNIETFVQEVGRCGRNGEEARATLFYNKTDIAANLKHLDDHMRNYCTTESCRRKFLLQYFGCTDVENSINPHKCCDNCKSTCTCELCAATSTQVESHDVTMSDEKKIKCAKEMLTSYFLAENNVVDNSVLPEAITGLSNSLAKTLSKNYEQSEISDILSAYPLVKENYAMNISKILSAVKCMKL